jgi:hypothetical protein
MSYRKSWINVIPLPLHALQLPGIVPNKGGLSREMEGSMKLSGVHLLLSYECNFECNHCFVWSGPRQTGTMTLETIRTILPQSKDLGSIEWVYFEGGDPFLYYASLLKGVQLAAASGFRVGLVSNSYWATSAEDALENLRPFAGCRLLRSRFPDIFAPDQMYGIQ